MSIEHNRLLEKYAGVNLKFTKKQCQDIVKMQILQLRADGEKDADIKEFFMKLLARKYNNIIRVPASAIPAVENENARIEELEETD